MTFAFTSGADMGEEAIHIDVHRHCLLESGNVRQIKRLETTNTKHIWYVSEHCENRVSHNFISIIKFLTSYTNNNVKLQLLCDTTLCN